MMQQQAQTTPRKIWISCFHPTVRSVERSWLKVPDATKGSTATGFIHELLDSIDNTWLDGHSPKMEGRQHHILQYTPNTKYNNGKEQESKEEKEIIIIG